MPGGRSVKENSPALVVTVLLVRPVSACSSLTEAPVTIAPDGSTMLPEMVPREVWARAAVANSSEMPSRKAQMQRVERIWYLLRKTWRGSRHPAYRRQKPWAVESGGDARRHCGTPFPESLSS